MKKRRLFLGLALASLTVFTLSACGEDEKEVNPTVVDDGGDTGEGQGGQGEDQGGQGEGQGEQEQSKTVEFVGESEVVTNGEVNILSSNGKAESADFTFTNVSDATEYNIYVDNNKVDNKVAYITALTQTISRCDLIGLKPGKHDVLIVPVKNGSESNGIKTKIRFGIVSYDRSGYAHFKNKEGVGAYNDDGTLKDNAIVLYVTDENKNTISLTYKNKTVTGIGNILNSVGQAYGDSGHETECKKTYKGNSYYAKGNTNQGILLDLATDNIPLVVRFVGCVSNTGLYQPGNFDASQKGLIEGLTAYAKKGTLSDNAGFADYGGTAGDNGHMARMKSAKNVTFEGVGDNATIDGWGFHLICETAHKDLARNFEVRNLAFINTPEDAIGMEGQENESSLTITAAVERCWVHHNTFLKPEISNPAESDKKDGDGSVDFKRGRYFSCSYNYFENCHKTNLVGSSDSSVQYCLTYHHNIWYNCAARQPLARRANIHFYNNLIIGTTDTVASLRAESYMYAESNYYMGCSRPVEYKAEDGASGVCKSYQNILVGCYNDYSATVAKDREEQIASNCKDNAANISYANFDTNSEIFYYNSANKKSDCYLTDAATARIECIKYSGSSYRTVSNNCDFKNDNIKITDVASSAVITGACSLSISKAKGVIKVFTVASPVLITISATSDAGYDTGYLLKDTGELILELSSTDKTAVLENGVYVIVGSVAFTGNNGKNDKETLVTNCTFEPYNSEELKQKIINSYNEAVNNIPATISFTENDYNAIKTAIDIYETLGDLKTSVDYTKVESAYNAYKNLAKTQVEEVIGNIGTISKDSGDAITEARNLYNLVVARCPGITISNYQTLLAAENAYQSFALEYCINAIDAIGTVTLDSESLIIAAENLYNMLDENQKENVTNYSVLVSAREEYDRLYKINEVISAMTNANTIALYNAAYELYNALSATEKNSIDSTLVDEFMVNYAISLINTLPTTISLSDGNLINKIGTIYDSLSSDNKALVTNVDKYLSAKDAYETLSAEAIECTFADSPSSPLFTVSGNYGNTAATIAGVAYTRGLKMETNTSVTFTTSSAKTMTLHVTAGKKIKIDNVSYTVPSDGVLTIQLSAGSHTIAKDTTSTLLYYVQLV